ncbi:hypothetical protein DPMN_028533 [Dreissena polymorpha]|uniref:Uncharacterized protein n=1 Tax=Dreissena polymorpha TaxID=45954 RepID=A0A9D4LXC3_DREPO|nr:hypothetical protein DPMN_028533 [Dreissena polymorpha]
MMEAMDPMSAMMGAMSMGMPFMSYDTLEEMLDRPDRRIMPGWRPEEFQTLLASFQREFPIVSAAVKPIGSGAHAAPSISVFSHGTSSTGASALQTALSRRC